MQAFVSSSQQAPPHQGIIKHQQVFPWYTSTHRRKVKGKRRNKPPLSHLLQKLSTDLGTFALNFHHQRQRQKHQLQIVHYCLFS
jgi:hypothetical protein